MPRRQSGKSKNKPPDRGPGPGVFLNFLLSKRLNRDDLVDDAEEVLGRKRLNDEREQL